jgi:hypothetical protein
MVIVYLNEFQMHSRSANLFRIDNDIIVEDRDVVDELDILNKYSLYNLVASDSLRFNAMATSTGLFFLENSLYALADISCCLSFCRLASSSFMIACMSRGEILSICVISA